MNPSWSEFKLRIDVRSSFEKIYRAWATVSGLESWFLRKVIVQPKDQAGGPSAARGGDDLLQKGDEFEWWWYGHPDSVSVKGKVLAANGKDVFSFTFSLDAPVTISLYRECDETIVELVESGLPSDEESARQYFVGDSRGWIFYLANLKSVLEGGLDLRNRKMELTNVINS